MTVPALQYCCENWT